MNKIQKTLATIVLGATMPILANAQIDGLPNNRNVTHQVITENERTVDLSKYAYTGSEKNDIIEVLRKENRHHDALGVKYLIPSTGGGESYITEGYASKINLEKARRIAKENNISLFYDITNKVIIYEVEQTVPEKEHKIRIKGYNAGAGLEASRKLIEYKADWDRYKRLKESGSKIYGITNQGELIAPSKIEQEYKVAIKIDGAVSGMEYFIPEKF